MPSADNLGTRRRERAQPPSRPGNRKNGTDVLMTGHMTAFVEDPGPGSEFDADDRLELTALSPFGQPPEVRS